MDLVALKIDYVKWFLVTLFILMLPDVILNVISSSTPFHPLLALQYPVNVMAILFMVFISLLFAKEGALPALGSIAVGAGVLGAGFYLYLMSGTLANPNATGWGFFYMMFFVPILLAIPYFFFGLVAVCKALDERFKPHLRYYGIADFLMLLLWLSVTF